MTCRQIDRFERATVERIELSPLYLLELHFGFNPAVLLRCAPLPRSVAKLGTWPKDAPPLPRAEDGLRRAVREARQMAGLGTPALAQAAGVHQSWLVRLETGQVKIDLVRVCLIAEALGTTGERMLPAPFVSCEVTS